MPIRILNLCAYIRIQVLFFLLHIASVKQRGRIVWLLLYDKG